MKIEPDIENNEITFTVKTDRLGKWGIIHAIEQVNDYWKNVRHHAVYKRRDFESIIIKIERVDVL